MTYNVTSRCKIKALNLADLCFLGKFKCKLIIIDSGDHFIKPEY